MRACRCSGVISDLAIRPIGALVVMRAVAHRRGCIPEVRRVVCNTPDSAKKSTDRDSSLSYVAAIFNSKSEHPMPRAITRSIHLEIPPGQAFALLHTPSAICRWWSARQAIVIPRPGGFWAATWGESEDEPEYVSAARISEFSPPHRLMLTDFLYHAPAALPFDPAELTTEFVVEAAEGGSRVRVTQRGFPDSEDADEFYAACERGWDATLAGIRRFVAESRT